MPPWKLCARILLLFLWKLSGKLSMFSVQFYVNFLMFFLHYQSLLQNRAHNICAIFYPMFWYFRNKDHWWGLRSESKRLKVCNLLSLHFQNWWTLFLNPILNRTVWCDKLKKSKCFCSLCYSYFNFLTRLSRNRIFKIGEHDNSQTIKPIDLFLCVKFLNNKIFVIKLIY